MEQIKVGDFVKIKDNESHLNVHGKGLYPGIHYEVELITQDDGFRVKGNFNYFCMSNFIKVNKVETFLHHDYLKRKLNIGDKVVFMRSGYRSFSTGIIKRFTKVYVIVEIKNKYSDTEFKQLSEQLIKII